MMLECRMSKYIQKHAIIPTGFTMKRTLIFADAKFIMIYCNCSNTAAANSQRQHVIVGNTAYSYVDKSVEGSLICANEAAATAAVLLLYT